MVSHYSIAIPFRDIDMHGHMHNAAHVSHFEAGISCFLRSAKLSEQFAPNGSHVFHVRKVAVEFHAPSHYDEMIEIECRIGHLGRSSLGFTPRMVGAAGDLRATAEILWICINRQTGRSSEIPEELRTQLEPHLIAARQTTE